ncbi:hydantoinase/oxoprolinase family protein [Acuticoccus sp. I52.16.1]|uniref:hydantoinase/oxoprolinase family protein n=1 Tax=Acuticoccus sp. I52.16.1 TaxID=2928472 RepID=UPI001FD22AFE|nr:hydantoinase/oxoprolinase family protein [Acuticoccus sp. I52.16.1]UOM35470.1 hydantoinase/oxoprolinase family protein [Acuticoccus sp. I52.16.1]
MRFAVDTGGTFTDLIVEDGEGALRMFKASTTPDDPIRGVIDSLAVAADGMGRTLADLLGEGELFIHGTTHAINAIITGNTAKTAFLTTRGHPDILVLREGGRTDVFNFAVGFPAPYVPRSLTYEVTERVLADGSVKTPLDEAALVDALADMKAKGVEAVGVCLMWSILNGAHERRVGALVETHLPGVPYTLSHQLNPSLREYRRASSTVIDASLKPLMGSYMRDLTRRLEEAGFKGRTLIVTSNAGVIDAADAAAHPVHLINSGPSMAPVAGRHFAGEDAAFQNAVIADTGGTTYDLSLVRGGRIPRTRETWIGAPYRGHMTGFPSVDVRSIGAGGGSIAWVDDGGMLHVGPQSAGARPGPASYGQGGTKPTLTDACLVLGYLDPAHFLGGAMALSVDAARGAIEAHLCGQLGLSAEEAAAAVVRVATENMVQAIMEITVNQGIDPASAVLIGGGGAAGLNSAMVATRLECPLLVIPEVGAALSAAGALMSDLSAEFRSTQFSHTGAFDAAAVDAVLDGLRAQCEAFVAGPGAGSVGHTIELFAEARYPDQVWEIEVAVPTARFASVADVRALVAAFHAAHEEVFAIHDPESEIEVIGWAARVSCRLRETDRFDLTAGAAKAIDGRRPAFFPGYGWTDAAVRSFDSLGTETALPGPAIIESPFTTVVVDPDATVKRMASGSLAITPARQLAAAV